MINVFEDTPEEITPVQQAEVVKGPPRKWKLGNDNDRNELYQLLMIKTLVENPDAIAKNVGGKTRESNILRDENGNVSGTKNSLMTGIHATAKNQTDMFKALKADALKRYGIKG